jgi:integrase
MLLSIQRKSEVAEAVWPEFDLISDVWTIPPERMKSDAPHVVPLPPAAVSIIKALPRFDRGVHVFSTTAGKKAVNGFSVAKRNLDELMLEELRKAAKHRGEDPDQVELVPFVLHDLRRTGRTHLSALPIPDLVRELVIAHRKPGLHKVYDQFEYLEEKRDALKMWADRLLAIVGKTS